MKIILTKTASGRKQKDFNHKGTKTQRNHKIILLIPFLIRGTLKFIRNPSRFPEASCNSEVVLHKRDSWFPLTSIRK